MKHLPAHLPALYLLITLAIPLSAADKDSATKSDHSTIIYGFSVAK